MNEPTEQQDLHNKLQNQLIDVVERFYLKHNIRLDHAGFKWIDFTCKSGASVKINSCDIKTTHKRDF